MHRIAAGTAALVLYTVWLGPSAAGAGPPAAAPAVNAQTGSPSPSIFEQEALLTAYERADRAHRDRPTYAAKSQRDAAVPPAPPAPAQPSTASKPPTSKPSSSAKPSSSVKPSSSKSTKSGSSSKQPATVAAPSDAAGTVVNFALAQVGKPYVYARSGPDSYDCSGLVMAAYARVGIKLPHQSEQIAARGRQVPSGQWLPGDVIHTSGHVAIYIGNGKMVEAANPSAGVRVAPVRGGTAYRFL
ncbi:C40 family peptidase [Dactylosporangium sp. NPDC000555]|uniref:C40 family peptidase n=1 Tax=Dactylosporangium sp. NPDC000555 TaxID=3154260 RepID=UPI0033300414